MMIVQIRKGELGYIQKRLGHVDLVSILTMQEEVRSMTKVIGHDVMGRSLL